MGFRPMVTCLLSPTTSNNRSAPPPMSARTLCAGESKGAEGRGIGPTITSMIDLRQGDPKTDLVIQDLAVPGALRRLYEETTTTFDVIDRSADGDWNCHKPNPGRVDDAAVDPGAINNSLVMAMIGRDDAEGVMRMNPAARDNADGLLTVDWRDPEARSSPGYAPQPSRRSAKQLRIGRKSSEQLTVAPLVGPPRKDLRPAAWASAYCPSARRVLHGSRCTSRRDRSLRTSVQCLQAEQG